MKNNVVVIMLIKLLLSNLELFGEENVSLTSNSKDSYLKKTYIFKTSLFKTTLFVDSHSLLFHYIGFPTNRSLPEINMLTF